MPLTNKFVIVISEILRVDTLPEGSLHVDSIRGFDWHIDTKYYTADIKLCSTKTRTIGDQDFAESMQAFVIYFDPSEVHICNLNVYNDVKGPHNDIIYTVHYNM